MSEDRSRIEEVERSMEATRGRMAATAAELDEAVSSRVAAAKESIDLRRVVVEHPWPSLLVAVGAGILLARSGTDERAAHAAADAARKTPAAAKRGATRAAHAIRDAARRRGDAGSNDTEASREIDREIQSASDVSTRPQGLAARVSDALHGDELLEDMRGEADRIGGAAPERPRTEPRRIQ